jgi:hypothetical protein
MAGKRDRHAPSYPTTANPPPAAPQKRSNVPARSIGTERTYGLGDHLWPNASSDQRRPGDCVQSRAAATMAAIRFGARAVDQPRKSAAPATSGVAIRRRR